MTDFYYMAGNKLLVADDSLTIQKVIRLALSNEGYEIQAVSEGNDAIQQISLFRPDAVLIDVSLPGKSAFEVKQAINELSDLEEVRFVLMSSAFEKVDEAQADSVEFHGRLTKPFDPAHLRQVLSDVLAQVASKRMEPTSLLERPDEFEITPPPPLPPVSASDELWEEPLAPLHHDDDIKQLTESTLRMTGLAEPAKEEEFEWSISEPSLKPSTAMLDRGGNNLEIAPPASHDESELVSLPPLPVELPIEDQAASSPSDFYRSNSDAPIAPPPSLPQMDPMPSIPQAQIEAIIQRELQNTIQKMAEKLLPEVAERIIKQEIHRMLSETP